MATGANSALGIRVKTLFDSRSGLAELRKSLKEIQTNNIVKIRVDFDKSQLDQLSKQLKEVYGKIPTNTPKKTPSGANSDTQAQKEIDAIDKVVQKTILRRQVEEKILQLKQAQAINKNIDQEQKEIAKQKEKTAELQKQLELYRQEQRIKVVGVEKRYGNIGNTSQELQKYIKDLNNVVVKNGQLVNSNTGVVTSFKQLSSGLTQVSATARNSVGFFDKLKDSFIKFSTYLFAGNLIVSAFRAFKTGMQSVVELDSSLTNINMTMRITTSEMGELTSQSQQMASEMGVSVKAVLDAAKVYANANENISSILEKTKASIMLSTASGMNIESSTDSIQAIMNQFELSVEGSSMRIIDSLQAVSANMAFDFGRGINEISSAIQVSGSIAREAGFELEQYQAVVGAIIERTRLAGSQVGNSLKTIFSRLGRAKTGEASEEEISQTEKAYKSLGIALRDVYGEFREIPDVIDELSVKWENLTSVQKSYISEVSAGIR